VLLDIQSIKVKLLGQSAFKLCSLLLWTIRRPSGNIGLAKAAVVSSLSVPVLAGADAFVLNQRFSSPNQSAAADAEKSAHRQSANR